MRVKIGNRPSTPLETGLLRAAVPFGFRAFSRIDLSIALVLAAAGSAYSPKCDVRVSAFGIVQSSSKVCG